MTAAQPIVLVVSDAAVPTGFARVTRSIMTRLGDRYSFHQLGINYFGGPHQEPWPIFAASPGADDRYGLKRIASIVKMIRPAIVLIVNDIGLVAQYADVLSSLEEPPRLAAYMPIDSGPVALDYARGVASLEHIVVYNQFAANLLAVAYDELKSTDPSLAAPPVSIIPHGVDTDVFHPLFPTSGNLVEARRAIRRQLLPGSETYADAFIVLNANRNQPRKRLDITIAGFAQFAADKPDVMLYLHSGMTDLGWDIRELARRHGIMDPLIITHEGDRQPMSSLEQLNQIYNACDVGLNTAEAESWGLTSFEHAATAAAQVVPGHTGPLEIWDGAAETLPPTLSLTSPSSLTSTELIAPETVAATLERLYRDPTLLQQRALDAYKRATDPCYSWDTIAASFDELLIDLAQRPPRERPTSPSPTPSATRDARISNKPSQNARVTAPANETP